MTRITGSDHILLLLRERLARGERMGQAGRSATARAGSAAPLDRLRALTAFDGLNPDERRRAVVHGVLVDELGDAVGNDPAFQATLDEVVRIIGDLPEGPTLIDRAAAVLTGR